MPTGRAFDTKANRVIVYGSRRKRNATMGCEVCVFHRHVASSMRDVPSRQNQSYVVRLKTKVVDGSPSRKSKMSHESPIHTIR